MRDGRAHAAARAMNGYMPAPAGRGRHLAAGDTDKGGSQPRSRRRAPRRALPTFEPITSFVDSTCSTSRARAKARGVAPRQRRPLDPPGEPPTLRAILGELSGTEAATATRRSSTRGPPSPARPASIPHDGPRPRCSPPQTPPGERAPPIPSRPCRVRCVHGPRDRRVRPGSRPRRSRTPASSPTPRGRRSPSPGPDAAGIADGRPTRRPATRALGRGWGDAVPRRSTSSAEGVPERLAPRDAGGSRELRDRRAIAGSSTLVLFTDDVAEEALREHAQCRGFSRWRARAPAREGEVAAPGSLLRQYTWRVRAHPHPADRCRWARSSTPTTDHGLDFECGPGTVAARASATLEHARRRRSRGRRRDALLR